MIKPRRDRKNWPPFFLLLLPASGVILPLAALVHEALWGSSGAPQGMDLPFWTLFSRKDFPLWYFRTLVLSLMNVSAALVLNLVTALGLESSSLGSRKGYRRLTLFLQMYPPFLSLVALFILLDRLGQLNSFLGLILVYQAALLPFWSWYLWGLLSGLDPQYREAAELEGAGRGTFFRRIQLPLLAPGLGALTLAGFTLPWFDFILQSLVLGGENTTLAVGLFFWLGEGTPESRDLFAAGSLAAVFPPVMVYWLLHRPLSGHIHSQGGFGP